MRRPPEFQPDSSRFDINMTPMIDVVFQLLIFFVCTTNFQVLEELLPSNLLGPGSVAAAAVPPELEDLEEVVIKLTVEQGAPRWQVNQRAYTRWTELRSVLAALAGLSSDLPVILDISPDVSLGNVIDLYDLCRLAGFEKVQFAAGGRR
ncbi:MAG: biopolymer transporter ExbD [Planctomycetaceae bacterium]|nr:biopolymer transporter ExbD [Planctomycetaceae bacterium]